MYVFKHFVNNLVKRLTKVRLSKWKSHLSKNTRLGVDEINLHVIFKILKKYISKKSFPNYVR